MAACSRQNGSIRYVIALLDRIDADGVWIGMG